MLPGNPPAGGLLLVVVVDDFGVDDFLFAAVTASGLALGTRLGGTARLLLTAFPWPS